MLYFRKIDRDINKGRKEGCSIFPKVHYILEVVIAAYSFLSGSSIDTTLTQ